MGSIIEKCQTKKQAGYSILQWNTLCSKLATKQSFPKVAESFLTWSYRKELIKKFLQKEKPDILTIEEIDNYEEYKKEILDEIDVKYSGNFYEKTDKMMGIYFGVNSEKFTIIEEKKEVFDALDNIKNAREKRRKTARE